MIDEKVLWGKIISIFPEIDVAGIDINVAFSKKKDAWIVDLKKDDNHLVTHLDNDEAEKCLAGKKCLSLSILVEQLVKKANIIRMKEEKAEIE